MGITKFYTETLGANLTSVRWSWGATNPTTNHIFLRIWKDQLETIEGVERSLLFSSAWQSSSLGLPERKRHIDALKQGAEGYGVICTVKTNDKGDRKIKSYNKNELLVFGDLVGEGDKVYGIVTDRISVEAVSRPRSRTASVVPDLRIIQRSKKIDITEKERLGNARVGQGHFRAQVLATWKSKCCVTGTKTLDAIRASHIKPWRDSTDEERLDSQNGLPLVATLDALFDVGYISFESDGSMLVSKLIDDIETDLLNLADKSLMMTPSAETARYLEYHRKNIFR